MYVSLVTDIQKQLLIIQSTSIVQLTELNALLVMHEYVEKHQTIMIYYLSETLAQSNDV